MTHPVTAGWTQTLAWNRHDWMAVACFTAIINLMMLAPTLYMLQIYDRVMVSGSGLTLMAVSAITVFLLLVMALADWFRSRLLIRIGQSIDRRMAPAVFRATYLQRLQGRSVTAAQRLGDLTQVRQFLTGPGLLALMDIPWIPIYIAVLFLLHPMLGFIAIGFGALQLLLSWVANRSSVKQVDLSQQAAQSADTLGSQLLRQADVLSVMGMSSQAHRRWQARHTRALAAENALSAHQAGWGAVSKWLRYTQQSAALGAGAWLVIHGELSAGAMIAGNVLTTRALAPIDAWSQAWASALGAREALQRLRLLLDGSAAQASLPTESAGPPAGGEMAVLDNISFTVPGRAAPVLDQISLSLALGQITVVQGPSGSGKTTLVRVLMGIAQPSSGQVQRPASAGESDEWVGYLPQSIELFEGTIADNVARFGKADSAEVIAAARLAGLHETIQRMPLGYDTPIGVGGQFLSGGQRQRIGLARAVYRRPRLVVLDEPNAQLDSNGEAALQSALQQLKTSGSSVVVISHRPGVLSVADQAVTLAAGRMAGHAARPAPPVATMALT